MQSTFDQINALRPRSILDVVPREVFIELGQTGYEHIGNGNCFEWKYAIAKWLQPKSILEIGVRYGYSLASFIMGSHRVKRVVGWDKEIYKPGSNVQAAAGLHLLPIGPSLLLIKTDSREMSLSDQFGDYNHFDLIHIDSSHTYEGCLHDLNLCLGHTKAILVDDTLTCPDDMRAVRQFCQEQSEQVRELIHIPSHVGESLILLA